MAITEEAVRKLVEELDTGQQRSAMEGFGGVLIMSLVMLVGSYLAGSIPLFIAMSEEKLQVGRGMSGGHLVFQLVSVMGAGLLVGTALSVIIPEGMQTLNMAYSQTAGAEEHTAETGHQEHEHHHENPVPHIIGVSLVLGFIFQLVVDQVALAVTSSRDVEGGRGRGAVSWTATLGLVVHAAADGVALGAAATTNQTDVEIIVFLAIMLHKAPASFGLVTYLMHEGLERGRIRKHLLVFALAAPVLALLTYLLLTVHGQGNMNTLSGTGIAMLFSAGTFLYVATVHVLPEVSHWMKFLKKSTSNQTPR